MRTRPETSSPPAARQNYAGLRLLATVSGILGFILFVLTPVLPIVQTQSSVQWPQNSSLAQVSSPLISVAPESIDATIPVAAVDYLRPGQTMLYGTVPLDSPQAISRGLFVQAFTDEASDSVALTVTSRDEVIASFDPATVAQAGDNAMLSISSHEEGTVVRLHPAGAFSGTTVARSASDEDLRPQLTGVYTEIDDSPAARDALLAADPASGEGISVAYEINSRFTSSPSTLKLLAIAGGLVMLALSLWSLWRIDRSVARTSSAVPVDITAESNAKVGARGAWLRLSPLDGVVAAVLGYWHIFGANTSDDGFILTMGRIATNATYMANYYRWYGVPEAPFGSPFYDLIGALAQISPASPLVRLPALIAAIIIWLLLSREILPRFGPRVNDRRMAHWTAAMMFLAFWLPFNNGTRPEPMVALGVMVTWVAFERGIDKQKLLPFALGTIAATVTLAAGPTGLFAVGVFLICVPRLFAVMARYAPTVGWPAVLAPFLSTGTAILAIVFADQSFAAVLESTRVRAAVGPSLDWYSEYLRYASLLQQSVDGSMNRRFAMLTMGACLGLILYTFTRNRNVVGAPTGPTTRLLLMVGLSVFFLMFTPTKWTHHFGIYAGVAGIIAALGAVVLSDIALRSPRARTFSLAGVTFLMALTTAGWNGWWYVSSFGIPWWDRTIQYQGFELNTALLAATLVLVAVGIVQSIVHSRRRSQAQAADDLAGFRQAEASRVSRWAGVMSAPIAVACAGMVAFSCASFAKAYIEQYPAYSVGLGNLRSLSGNTCGLAADALVETNTAQSFLQPVRGDFGDSLVDETEPARGFDPNFIPEKIDPDASSSSATVGAIGQGATADAAASLDGTEAGEEQAAGAAQTPGAAQSAATQSANAARTAQAAAAGGVRGTAGINGSVMHLPFNLDYTAVPVIGSYQPRQTGTSTVTTQWFELPERSDETPVLVVSAAGNIYHHDVNDVEQDGMELSLEYGALRSSGAVEKLGTAELRDVGSSPQWRNLRLGLDSLPEEATVVRLVATDDSTYDDDWLAFIPPRVPTVAPLAQQFPQSVPGLLDWTVALQFPCQRSFDHYAGVTEIPQFRVLPDSDAERILSIFQSYDGGGALSTAEAVNYSYELPSYLSEDWARDWGSVRRYVQRTNSVGDTPQPAEIRYEEIRRSGLWKNSSMKIIAEDELRPAR